CGTRAPASATTQIQCTAAPGTHTAARAAGSATGARAATAKPPTVATGTNGPASTFAGTDTQLTSAESSTSSGAHATWAARATATASASHAGSRRAQASRQRGASTMMPPVASTDSANPKEAARAGSNSSSPITAAARVATPMRGRPTASDTR